MDITDCGMFQASGFGINEFENMESSIREKFIYLTTTFE
jgi:hypothetical protein